MQKRKKFKGFTLAELLIVVALVSILTAISIPIFNGKKEKAYICVDLANARSAKAAAIAEYLTTNTNEPFVCYYDAENGTITKDPSTIEGYGKTPYQFTQKRSKEELQKLLNANGYPINQDNKPQILKVEINDTTCVVSWCDGANIPVQPSTPSPTIPPLPTQIPIDPSTPTLVPEEELQDANHIILLYMCDGRNFLRICNEDVYTIIADVGQNDTTNGVLTIENDQLWNYPYYTNTWYMFHASIPISTFTNANLKITSQTTFSFHVVNSNGEIDPNYISTCSGLVNNQSFDVRFGYLLPSY